MGKNGATCAAMFILALARYGADRLCCLSAGAFGIATWVGEEETGLIAAASAGQEGNEWRVMRPPGSDLEPKKDMLGLGLVKI